MKENGSIGQDNISHQHERKLQWKLIHHSLIFWIFALLMLVGIIYYVITFGFALTPVH